MNLYGKLKLAQLLKKEVVDIIFTKLDGSERLLRATLKGADFIINPFKYGDKTSMSVFDDAIKQGSAWRSFRFDRIKSINGKSPEEFGRFFKPLFSALKKTAKGHPYITIGVITIVIVGGVWYYHRRKKK